jgi:uncharacterized membrane protein AbrB (regulator of aidB expression)
MKYIIIFSILVGLIVMVGCTNQIGPSATTQPSVVFEPGSIVVNMQIGSTTQPAVLVPVNVLVSHLVSTTQPQKDK